MLNWVFKLDLFFVHFSKTQVIKTYEIKKPTTDFEIQVLSMSAMKCQDDFVIFKFVLAIHQQKKLPKTQQKP